jgi:hypothetical protein
MGKTANNMATIYLVETKTFYTGSDNYEYQIADLGTLPHLFTSFQRAVKQMEICRKVHTQIFDETIVRNYRADEITDQNCYDRFETRHNTTGSRTIVSLYKKETL